MVFNCIKCKGRLHCGLSKCPLINKFRSPDIKISKEFKSSTHGILIGWNGYPRVNGGILTPFNSNESINYDSLKNANINDIINYRSSLVNSYQKINVKSFRGFSEFIQSSALSYKPLSVDVSLEKSSVIKPSFNLHALPNGPSIIVNKLVLNDDPAVKKVIRRVTDETDVKAVNSISKLVNKGVDIFTVSNLLSAGLLGLKRERKLVPTRWSITAVDDTLSKEFINKIRLSPIIDLFKVFQGELHGNQFTVILSPYHWSFELVEQWLQGSVFNNGPTRVVSDFERFNSRKNYAFNTTGGYYAARLGVTEWLASRELQASVIIIRTITKDYFAPLGVWVVREGVRKTMSSKPSLFYSWKSVVEFIKSLTNYDIRQCVTSRLHQSSLNDFMV